MRGHANAAGLDDAVIVNTCAVTGEAVRQARQTIRKIRRENPDKQIIVTGCAAQTERRHVRGHAGSRSRARQYREARCRGSWADARRRSAQSVTDIMAVRQTAMTPIEGIEGRARAIVQVQNGCDHRCTFCVIPFGRGNSRSVPMADVVAQVRKLAANGYREIVLTGVDITSYGEHLPDAPKLGALVKRVLKEVPEIERLRLSSINSVEADADLLDAFANEPRLMPHLHLSLQAGDDLILKRMKRRHSRADAIAFCENVKRLRPDVVFGADIIAGFPTEDEAMFARSLDLVDECCLTHLHVFPFSPRPGHAGRAHAAARSRRDQGARRASAREGRGGLAASSLGAGRQNLARADRIFADRPHRAIHAGSLSGRADARPHHRSSAWPDTMAAV